MPLCDIETHLDCDNYASDSASLFRQYRLSAGEVLPSPNERRSVLLYIAEGRLLVEWVHFPRQSGGAGVLLLAPKNLRFSGAAVCSSRLVACFFTGQLPLCNKYSFLDLSREVCKNFDRSAPPPELYRN